MKEGRNPEDAELLEWFNRYYVPASMNRELESFKQIAETGEEKELDEVFHCLVKSMFHWEEKQALMDEMQCPVQRGLVLLSLNHDGEGFINVRYLR